MLMLSALPIFAAGNSAPKATGSYDYNIGGLDRHADFNAIATSVGCSYTWDVTGTWLLDFAGGTDNRKFVDLVQDSSGNVTGEFWYLSGVVWLDGGTLNGNVSENTLYLHYVRPFPLTYVGDFYGTIGDDIITAGTFSDNNGNNLTWTATGTSEKVYGGCTGKGVFNYSDANGTYYTVDVKYVSVQDNEAWFAGEVVSGNWGNYGTWLFVRVTDNGETGIGVDETSGTAGLTESVAKSLVASHATPQYAGTIITGGNIQVH